MVSMDKVMTISYRLLVVIISLLTAVWHNCECKVSACSHHPRAQSYRMYFSVDCSVI